MEQNEYAEYDLAAIQRNIDTVAGKVAKQKEKNHNEYTRECQTT